MPVSSVELRESLNLLSTEQLLSRRASGALTEAAEAIADELLSERGVGPERRVGGTEQPEEDEPLALTDAEPERILAVAPTPRAPWLLIKIAIIAALAPLALLLIGTMLSSAIPGCEHTGGELTGHRYFNCAIAGIDVSTVVRLFILYGSFGTFIALGYVFMPSMLIAFVWCSLRLLMSERSISAQPTVPPDVPAAESRRQGR